MKDIESVCQQIEKFLAESFTNFSSLEIRKINMKERIEKDVTEITSLANFLIAGGKIKKLTATRDH